MNGSGEKGKYIYLYKINGDRERLIVIKMKVLSAYWNWLKMRAICDYRNSHWIE